MKNEQKNTNVEFTKELYVSMSTELTGQIAQTKQDKEDIISKIRGRIDYLKELRSDIAKRNEEIKLIKLQKKNIRIKIRDEKKLLRRDRAKKFCLSRELIAKKNNSAKLNTLYVNGEKTIDIKGFYPLNQQKTR